jgi:hypothetical protein
MIFSEPDFADYLHAGETDIVKLAERRNEFCSALAARSAWFAEKQSVTLTLQPC